MKMPEPTSETDASLIRRLRAGDATAFDTLFARHRRPLLAYVFGMLNDAGRAEDIVQDCFLELVRRIESVDPGRNVAGWLYRVARNKAIDAVRRRKFETGPADDERALSAGRTLAALGETDPAPSPLDAMLQAESAARVQAALAALPLRERDVIALHYFGDLRFREIAKLARRPLGTVLWQARNALAKMKQLLENDHEKQSLP